MKKYKALLISTLSFFVVQESFSQVQSHSSTIKISVNNISNIKHYEKNSQISIEVPNTWIRIKPEEKEQVMIFKDSLVRDSDITLIIQSLVSKKKIPVIQWALDASQTYKTPLGLYHNLFRKWHYISTNYINKDNNQKINFIIAFTEQLNSNYAIFFVGPNVNIDQLKPILDSVNFFHLLPQEEPAELAVLPTPTPVPTVSPQDIWDRAFSSAKNGDFETGISLLETLPDESDLAQKSKIKIHEWKKILVEQIGKKAFEDAMQLATKGDYSAAIEQLKKISKESSFYQKGQVKLTAWQKIIIEKEGKILFSKAIKAASSGDFKSAITHAENVSKESSYYQKITQKKLEWQKILLEKAARSDFSGLTIDFIGVPDDLAVIFKKYKYELVKALKSRPDGVEGLFLPATLIIDFKKEEPLFTFWVNTDRKSFQMVKEQGYTFIHHFGSYWLMGIVQYWYQALVSQLYEGSDEEKEICKKYCRQLNPIANTWYSVGLYTSKDSYFRQFSRTNLKGDDAIFSNQVEIKLPNQKSVFIDGRKLNGTGRKSFVFVMPELNSHNKAVYSFFGLK